MSGATGGGGRGRIALGCLGLAFVVIVAVVWVGYNLIARNAVVGPEEAGGRLDAITELTLPDGYQPQFALTMRGMTTVTLVPDFGGDAPDASMIYTLMQSDASAEDADAARDQLADEMASTAGGRSVDLTEVERRPVTVRGAPTTLVIYEGPRRDGTALRKAVVAFDGDGGPALLVAAAPIAAWDEPALMALLASFSPPE